MIPEEIKDLIVFIAALALGYLIGAIAALALRYLIGADDDE